MRKKRAATVGPHHTWLAGGGEPSRGVGRSSDGVV
jgi:hypothetical protein